MIAPAGVSQRLRDAVKDALGASVLAADPLGGGCINEAFRVTLSDGRIVFLKTNPDAPTDLFETEARGLTWLSESETIRVPNVLAVSKPDDIHPFLALEFLAPAGERARDFDERLGHELAALHRFGTQRFGLDHDNYIGSLPQSNRSHDRWADFYRSERLEPQLRLAVDRGLTTGSIEAGFVRVFAHLEDLAGPPEAPARLHGDLWSGNIHVDASGCPALIDPAVYGGHRQIDLAMMQFAGGLPKPTIAAYNDVFPLPAGWRDRMPLYQLYPLVVHLNLFGRTYVGPLQRALSRC